MKFGSILLACGAALVFAGVAGAGTSDLVTNGSFETPVVAGGFQQFPNSIPGWTGSVGIELQANGVLGGGQGTPFGNQYAELVVESPSSYSQTLSTVGGVQYTLSFDFAARPGTGTNNIRVGFTGNADMNFTAADTGTVSFQRFTETLKADGAQSVLSFTPLNVPAGQGGGDLLDNVSVTAAPNGPGSTSAVPLPAAFWTGLSGFLAAGIAIAGISRRRIRTA